MKSRFEFLFAIVFLLLALIFFGGLAPGLRYITVGFILLGGGYWLLRNSFHRHPVLITRSILVSGVYIVYQTAILSVAPLPVYSTEKVLDNFQYFLIFIFLVNFLVPPKTNGERPSRIRVWENALIFIAIILSIIELLLVGLWYFVWWRNSTWGFSLPPFGYRLSGTFLGHPNIMAGFLNLLLPIALIRLLIEKRRSRQIVWMGILLLFAVIEYYSSSRGGWVSAFGGLTVTLFLVYVLPLVAARKNQSWKKVLLFIKRNRIFLAGGLVFLSGVIYLLIRNIQMTPAHAGRLGLWQNGWKVWMKSPLLGHGVSSYAVMNALEVKLPPGFATAHAHNFWLQIGAETGLVGIVFVLAILGTAVMSWMRAWRESEPSSKNRYFLAAHAGAGSAVLSHGIVDYIFDPPFYVICITLIFTFIMGRERNHPFIRLPSIPSYVGFGLVLCWGAANIFLLRGEALYWQGVTFGRQGDWQKAQGLICQAADKRPDLSIYQFQCGLASAYQFEQAGDPALLEMAEKKMEEGLALDPYWPVHMANQSMIKWQRGDKDEALASMHQAVEAAPYNVLFWLNLAWMEDHLGNTTQAEKAYANAAKYDSWLRYNLHNQGTIPSGDDSTLPNHIQAYELLLEGEMTHAVERLELALEVDPTNAEAYALRAVYNQAQGEPLLAWKDIQTALLLDSSPRVHIWAAEIAIKQDKIDKAQEYLERAHEQLRRHNEYSEKYYYGVYHRYFLGVDLVPGIKRGDISHDMRKGLAWLIDLYGQEGQADKADDLQYWLIDVKMDFER
jgi:tetratricopeptide (TPR) repeat protein/O-antigen ligase